MVKNFVVIDGMQQFVQPLDASITEPELIINYIGDVIKGKVARTGYDIFLDNPDNAQVYGIVAVTIKDATNGDKTYFLRFSGTHIYKFIVGSGAVSWGSAIFTFPNDPGGVCLVKYRNALFIASANGSNPLYYANHTGAGVLQVVEETATNVPTNPTTLAVYANCLFANDSAVPYRLKRSAVGYGTAATIGSAVVPFNGKQWVQDDNDPSTARFYDVNPDVNGLISGIQPINNKLHIFMASDTGDMGMYQFDLSSLLQVPTSVSIRPKGQSTITIAEDGSCYFSNNNGVYIYNGTRPQRSSLALNELAQDINPVCAIDFKQRYMVALSHSITSGSRTNYPVTITNPVLVKDQVSDEWVIFDTGHRMTCFGKMATSDTDPVYMYSGDENGNTYIWLPTSNTDAGKTIFGIIQFRDFYGATISTQLSLKELYAISDPFSGQRVQVRTFESEQWGRELPLDSKVTKIPVEGTSHTYSFAVMVTTASTGERPRFYGFVADFEDEGSTDGR